ncbi:hypothetical protein BKA70DRAFT_1232366 [Coprinopsis sp. MPI-PUGE-AT-0042]|nr:hypothetical protein BKA70DRAFT_1232366 [Coprinopsis sp. MPI-PUGE-AT-0042]
MSILEQRKLESEGAPESLPSSIIDIDDYSAPFPSPSYPPGSPSPEPNLPRAPPPTPELNPLLYGPDNRPGKAREAPSVAVALQALNDIQTFLRGKPRKCGGYKKPEIDPFVTLRLNGMRAMLSLYTTTSSRTYGEWVASSTQAAEITLTTAVNYLQSLDYRFGDPKKGQYTDGHEREDIVDYRTNVYIPKLKSLILQTRVFAYDTGLVEEEPPPGTHSVVIWYHNETIYYANDRRRKQWIHKDAKPTPYAKGDGPSLMIADFISADHGWLRSPDGAESARIVLKPGKSREGYMSNVEILQQFQDAVVLAKKLYPEQRHVFVYNNATTHLKRRVNALSARRCPKFTPPVGKNWLVEIPKIGPDGKEIPGQKEKVQMEPGTFQGRVHSLYWEEGHP